MLYLSKDYLLFQVLQKLHISANLSQIHYKHQIYSKYILNKFDAYGELISS